MAHLEIRRKQIASFCRERHIRRLAIFGSALRAGFRPDSDIDLLVEFEPDHFPGLFGIARMERELSALFEGRKVDLRTPKDLSRYFRQRVLEEAEEFIGRKCAQNTPEKRPSGDDYPTARKG